MEEFAKEKLIPIIDFNKIKSENRKYFLGISARFSRIIPSYVINKFEAGIITFHGGLLPEFGGLFSSCHTILENSKIGGGTIHFIDEGIDTGEIISRCEFQVGRHDTSVSVFQKTQKRGVVSKFPLYYYLRQRRLAFSGRVPYACVPKTGDLFPRARPFVESQVDSASVGGCSRKSGRHRADGS